VNRHFTQRKWERRVVALAAAYALLLSGLLANFSSARAVALAVADPAAAICHTGASGIPVPAPTEDGKHCVDNCCIGCLSLLAALPPETGAIALAPSRRAAVLLGFAIDLATAKTRAHRSRAPPLTA
jgi:hypothetical protein